ncbi:MAG: DUF1002 domain-containing protein, partial [Streptococcus lutetiensis]|nr:DUF1002 domain-containing protein [Streptococcus lutetiensis]
MKFKKTLMACALALFSTLTVGHVQAASNSVQDVIDETYVQPDYVLGYSLSDDQRNQTLSLLGYDSSKDTNVKTITTSAYAQIMDVADDPSLQLYSSVKIQKLGSSETLTVNIV